MVKEDFYIKKANCVGDYEHNNYVEILLNKLEFDPVQTDFLQKFFGSNHYSTGNWIFDIWTKKELKKVNTILRFYKNHKTLPSKISRFQQEFDRGCIYSAFLNNHAKGGVIKYWNDYLNKGGQHEGIRKY